MRKAAVVVTLLAVCLCFSVASEFPIKKIVVLMLENRSFDHMFGYYKNLDPRVNGLNGDEWNAYNTTDPNSAKVIVNPFAIYVDPDPNHSVPGTTEQVFGGDGSYRDPAPMDGFLQNAAHAIPEAPETVMACFNHSSVPIITALAEEFALCDACYASIPGPTEVNRMYAFSATSHGYGDTSDLSIILGFPQRTIFSELEEAGISWGVYFQEISSTLIMQDMRELKMLLHQHPFEQFFDDVAAGQLPQYSFLDPKYFPFLGIPANDQHPSHSVLEGERLMKKVYEALRASPHWNETLLMITYDEHGGFYDHQPTPLHNVPNPDGLNSTNPAFDFTRLGVRIPTLFVSPWINKNTVIHDPTGPFPSSKRDHASIPATLKKVFNLPSFLTKRDEWAGTFDDVVSERTSPRTDCPQQLPPLPETEAVQYEAEASRALSDLQRSFMALAAGLGEDKTQDRNKLKTKLEGAQYVNEMMARFFGRNGLN